MVTRKIAAISFDHMHMGDLLRMAHDHPDAEIAGIFDPDRRKMEQAIADFGIPEDRVFTDLDACMETVRPDLAILCAATADHADYAVRLASHGVHLLVEKPFAAATADARRMMAAMERAGSLMAINWPLVWVEAHVTAIEVDEHSITVCRYARGLSRMETRWGTFTDPWTIQPQPKCGFVFVGNDGTLSSYDYEDHVTVQTRARPEPHRIPADSLGEGRRNPIEYVLDCIARESPIGGPLAPALCLTAQRIVDTAALSAHEKRTLELIA